MSKPVKINGEYIEDKCKPYKTVGDFIKELEKLDKNKRIFHSDWEYGFSKPEIHILKKEYNEYIRVGDYCISEEGVYE